METGLQQASNNTRKCTLKAQNTFRSQIQAAKINAKCLVILLSMNILTLRKMQPLIIDVFTLHRL